MEVGSRVYLSKKLFTASIIDAEVDASLARVRLKNYFSSRLPSFTGLRIEEMYFISFELAN